MIARVLLLAAAVGLGGALVVAGLRRRPEAHGAEFKDVQQRAVSRVTAELGRQQLRQDAAIIGRTLEAHALAKLWAMIGGGGLVMAVGVMVRVSWGVGVPWFLLTAATAVGVLAGWWLPDSILKTEAAKERVSFAETSEAWLELVAQLVTAGAEAHTALSLASSYSEQPAFVAVREALAESSARGEPPWTGLRRLADERGLRFLDPFVSALELSGTTGVSARRAILAQVEAARSKSLHEADAKAASAAEKMGARLPLVGGAFMILMGCPPLAGIMGTDTFRAW